MTLRNFIAGLAAVVVAAFAFTNVSLAQTDAKAMVDAAKAQGVVGEQADGLLGFRTASSDAGLRAAVAEINAGRTELYREAARRNGVAVEAAGASAFTNVVFPRLPAGQYYRTPEGEWMRK